MLNRIVAWVSGRPSAPPQRPNHAEQMRQALARVRLAEMQVAEAASLEELDLGRTALQQAHAEVQQIIRSAKRARGIPVRHVEEATLRHQKLVSHLYPRPPAAESGPRRRQARHGAG